MQLKISNFVKNSFETLILSVAGDAGVAGCWDALPHRPSPPFLCELPEGPPPPLRWPPLGTAGPQENFPHLNISFPKLTRSWQHGTNVKFPATQRSVPINTCLPVIRGVGSRLTRAPSTPQPLRGGPRRRVWVVPERHPPTPSAHGPDRGWFPLRRRVWFVQLCACEPSELVGKGRGSLLGGEVGRAHLF